MIQRKRRRLTLSKTIAIDTAGKKLIIPVAKKLINTLDMDEEKIYVAHIQDGLIVVSEPWDGYAEAIFEQLRQRLLYLVRKCRRLQEGGCWGCSWRV